MIVTLRNQLRPADQSQLHFRQIICAVVVASVAAKAPAEPSPVVEAIQGESQSLVEVPTNSQQSSEVDGPFVEITPSMQIAIDRGLDYLSGEQQDDGSFGSGPHYGHHVAITSLAAMAFMSEGSLPNRGKYAVQVERGLDFVLANCTASGLIAANVGHGPMYGHAFSTLFLAEIYGMGGRDDLKEKLRKAIRLIEHAQNHEGGWRYQPVAADADLSVTVCQIMALRAARNVGIKVRKDVIDAGIEYIRSAQNPDGGFRYMLSTGASGFDRTAGAVSSLFYAGLAGGEEIETGLKYMERYLPGKGAPGTHYFYGQYYAVQAMYQAGGIHWQNWFPAIRDELLDKQNENGSWPGQAGPEYGTAMALIVMQIPNRLLPIFQR